MNSRDKDTNREQLFSELAAWTQNYLSEGIEPLIVFEALADLSYALYENFKKQIDLEHSDILENHLSDLEDQEEDGWSRENAAGLDGEENPIFTLRKKMFWEDDSIDVIPLLKAIHHSRTVEDFLSLAPFREH